MNDILTFAVGKLLKSKFEPTVGSTKVKGQVVVDVDAVINKAADELYVPSVHIPYLKVFANFAKISGITRDAALKNFKKAMIESLTNEKNAGEELENLVPDLEKFEEIISKEVLEKLPKQVRKGKVSVKGSVTVADPLPVAEAV